MVCRVYPVEVFDSSETFLKNIPKQGFLRLRGANKCILSHRFLEIILKIFITLILVMFTGLAQANQCPMIFSGGPKKSRPLVNKLRKAIHTRAESTWDKIKQTYIKNLVARGEYINNNDANGYLSEFLKKNDNREVVKKGLKEPLKGFSKSIEQSFQHVSTTNENGDVASWYKAFESGEYKTQATILSLLYKEEVKPREYDQAIKNIEHWVAAKRRMPADLVEITREGFEAYYQERAYKRAIWKYGRKRFAEYKVKYEGLPVEVPFYTLDLKTQSIVSEVRTITFYKFDKLVDAHRFVQKKTERIFGNKTNPVDLVVNAWRKRRQFQLRLYGNLDYAAGTIIRVPFGIIGNLIGTVKVGIGSVKWLFSLRAYKGESGELLNRYVEQAMLRRRLDMAIQAFIVREERLKEPLDEVERILFDDMMEVLVNPDLVPSGEAVKKAAMLELDAENSLSTGFDVDKQNTKELPDVAKIRDHSKYAHYQSQTTRGLGIALQYAKTYGVRVLLAGVLVTTGSSYLKKGADSLFNQPAFSYPMSVVKEGGYNLMADWFGYDSMVSANIRDAYIPGDFYKQHAVQSFVDGTESYRHKARRDGDKEYLNNPELVQKGDEILRASLDEFVDLRQVDQYNYVVNRMSDVIIPEYATEVIAESLTKRYPKHKTLIVDVFSKIKQGLLKQGFLKFNLSDLNKNNELFSPDIPTQLYKDLNYLLRAEGSFSVVVNYMLMNGPVIKSNTGLYYTFLEAPKNYMKLSSTSEVSFSANTTLSNALGENLRGEYVIVRGAPTAEGLVEIEFLSPRIAASPTGKYFAPIELLEN